jgi:hypothetical protein
MVKKAEVQKKRHPLTPVFGLLLAVGLFAIAYFLSATVVMKLPSVRTAVASNQMTLATVGFAVGIWVLFLALSFFLVAMLAGKDPEDAKQIPLPPKAKDMKKRR